MLDRLRNQRVPIAIDLPNPNSVVTVLQSGDTMVLADLSTSKNTTPRSLSEAAGFRFVFLPPSSPDGQSDRVGSQR